MSPLDNEMKSKLLIAFVMLFLFALGVYVGQKLPSVAFSHPIETYKIMKAFPVGTEVNTLETPEAKELFMSSGLWGEPGVVVGYEAVMLREKLLMDLQVRTKRGRGYTIVVNPSWIKK